MKSILILLVIVFNLSIARATTFDWTGGSSMAAKAAITSFTITAPANNITVAPGATFTITGNAVTNCAQGFNTMAFYLGSTTTTALNSDFNSTTNQTWTDSYLATAPSTPGTYIYSVQVTDYQCGGSSTQTVTVIVAVPIPPVLGNYAFSKPLVLKTSGSGISTTLTNFPALVYVQDNNLKILGICGDKVQYPNGNYNSSPNGTNYDFAFTLAGSTTELNYQVEKYDPVAGTLLAWVEIPSLTVTNLNLNFYFGSLTPNTTAHNAAFAQGTWAGDYQGVFHFNEGAFTGTVSDATVNGNTGTTTGMTATNFVTTGKINTAYTFDGATTKITMPASTSLSVSGTSLTVSAWVNMATAGLDQKIVSNQFAPSAGSKVGYKIGVFTNNKAESEYRGLLNRGSTPLAPTMSTSTWYYVQTVYSANQLITYVNGVPYENLASAGTVYTSPLTFYIGVGENGNQLYFSGTIDEVRVSNVVKTSDWIKAEYYNQSSPTTFTDYSGVVSSYLANAQPIPGALTYNWTGASSNNAALAANWSNTTPATTSDPGPAFTLGTSTLAIPSGLTIYPLLTADEAIYGLSIANGASLSLGGYTLKVGCNIYNNATAAGTAISDGGSLASGITWNGTLANQTYASTNTSNLAALGNMTVNNTNAGPGLITVKGGPVNITNILTITQGNLFIDNANSGVLTLKSTATQTAAVAIIPSAYKISGSVNVERYLSGGNTKDGTGRWTYRGYRLLSSPVSTVAPASYTTATAIYPYTLTYLANSSIVTGAKGGYNSGTNTFNSATAVGNPTLYLYRENITPDNTTFIGGNFKGVNDITGTSLTGTTDATKTTASVSVGNGFLFFFRGDRINNLTGSPSKTSAPYVSVEPVTFTSTGFLNQGTYTVQHWYNAAAGSPLLYTTVALPAPGNAAAKGYNLVGNPYASSINWDLFATTGTTGIVGTNMNNYIYVFNPVTNQYNTYIKGHGGIGTGTNLVTNNTNTKANLIASGQGFFIRANAASPTLTFYETAKAPTQQAALPASGFSMLAASASQNSANQLQYMRLALVKDSINNSDILFFFDPASSTKFSGQEDAEYLSGNGAPESLASMSSDSVKLAINGLPLPKKSETRIINLVANATASGQYTFLRNDLKNVPALYDIWLMDNFKKDSLDIKHNSTYVFNIDKTDTNTFGSKRFQIVIRQDPALGLHLLDFTAAKVTGGALIGWKTENEDNYTNFTVERSTDNGSTFTALGSLVSNNLGTYSFTDPKPPVTADQYRLKLTDLDGDITYSKVVTLMYAPLSNAKQISISIYPNPATSILNLAINLPDNSSRTISSQTQSYNIKIINVTGATVKDDKSSQPTWQTNISTLLPGTYIIRVLNNKDNTLVGKTTFVKL